MDCPDLKTVTQGAFQTKSIGYNIITTRELLARRFADVLVELHEKLKSRPIYLFFDMNVFDPSCAPGVVTPSLGGLSAREGIELLRGLAGLDIIAVDLNTVSPLHDVQNMGLPCGPGYLREPAAALPKAQLR